MKMEVPGLADSLQQYLCVNSGTYAGDVLDTDPGWQQSKLIWALSAEVGSASRMHCTGLWHVKAAQQPFSTACHEVLKRAPAEITFFTLETFKKPTAP